MKKVLFIAVLVMITNIGFGQDLTKGLWYNAEKTSKLQFYKKGDKLYAKIVWMKEPNKNGKAKIDDLNPKDNLKSRALMGLTVLENLVKSSDKVWDDGSIYDPLNGKTYSCKITIENDNLLSLRGYIGISIIGRSSAWTRAE
jgi:uncharacterized protein (DUF2147 family)